MKQTKKRKALFFLVIGRTLARFNPANEPIIPAYLVIYGFSVFVTILFVIQLIQHTFIKEYGKLALSAWCFVLLMNFLEVIGEICREK